MKKTLMGTALVLSLLGGTSALAQPDDHHGGGGGPPPREGGHEAGREGGHEGGQRGGPPQGAPAGRAGPMVAPQGGAQGAPHGQGERFGGAAERPQAGETRPQGGERFQRGERFQGGERPQGGGERFQGREHGQGGGERFQGGEQGRARYNAHNFPRTVHPEQRFHWRDGEWRGPPGYYYRHWGYGQRLPWGWFGARWYIDDFDDYDLSPPPWGYEWIRMGPDALLVNVSTGLIVEAVYGLFW
jgi:Ni/Co efflux regulator RcnB